MHLGSRCKKGDICTFLSIVDGTRLVKNYVPFIWVRLLIWSLLYVTINQVGLNWLSIVAEEVLPFLLEGAVRT